LLKQEFHRQKGVVPELVQFDDPLEAEHRAEDEPFHLYRTGVSGPEGLGGEVTLQTLAKSAALQEVDHQAGSTNAVRPRLSKRSSIDGAWEELGHCDVESLTRKVPLS